MNEKLFNVLRNMLPQATVKQLNADAVQLHWIDGSVENSITFFNPSDAITMSQFSHTCNDIAWEGDVRFSSTVS